MVLLIGSLMFYAWGEPRFVFIMLGSILVNYAAGLAISKWQDCGRGHFKQGILILTLIFDLGILAIFKYLGFFVDNLNNIFGLRLLSPDIPLPIGISFFTFQAISYVADVYTGGVKAQKNLFKVALYISLFPQLIAGPIVRYSDIEVAIDCRKESIDDFSEGIQRFIIGLAKKVLLADQLALLADSIINNTNISGGLFYNISVVSAWTGAIAYALQIYFDFSGYSDMAIGLGRVFGFKFQENFNYPYVACSVRDFWKRWHISLSTWFRDYVYIPLGGSKGTKCSTVRNLCIVWLLTGFWHGASWNFVIWGGCFLILLLLERYIFPMDKIMKGRISKFLYRIFTLGCVCCNWIIFRNTKIMGGIYYIGCMLGINAVEIYKPYDGFIILNNIVLLIVALVCCVPCKQWIKKFIIRRNMIENSLFWTLWMVIYIAILFVILILCVASIARGNYSPFIYFNF